MHHEADSGVDIARVTQIGVSITPVDAQPFIAELDKVADDRAIDLHTAVRAILEGAVAASGADRAALALTPASRHELVARMVVGRDHEQLLRRFSFRLDPSGGRIGVAISRSQELMIAKNAGAGPAEQRLLRMLDAGSFFVLPLALSGRTIGAFYVDSPSLDLPSNAAIAVARHMRDTIGRAMLARTGVSASAA